MDLSIHDVLNAQPGEMQILFPKLLTAPINLRNKNVEVSKLYTNIIKEIRYLLSRMSYPEHRTYLMTSYEKVNTCAGCVLFEFVCVMCTLTLNIKEYCYSIELETDSDIQRVIGEYNYNKMLRAVYRLTMWENTAHDLEDIVSIETNMIDHYGYFIQQIRSTIEPGAMLVVEDAILE